MSASVGNDGSQVKLLRESFAKIKPKGREFILSFYDNLFEDYSAVTPLFKKSNMQGQAEKLLEALDFVVSNADNPEALAGPLRGLGARHVKYGALPEHYPLVGNSLIKTFGQYLGTDWTPATQQAWIDAYGTVVTLVLEGADYSEAEVDLKSAPATASSAKSTLEPIDEDGVNWPILVGIGGLGIGGIILLLILL